MESKIHDPRWPPVTLKLGQRLMMKHKLQDLVEMPDPVNFGIDNVGC